MSDEAKQLTVVIEKTGTGYSAYLPEIPGVIATGDSLVEVKKNINEALDFHLEGLQKEAFPVPEELKGDSDLIYKMDISSFFEWFSGILTKSGIARTTGMNMSLIRQYSTGIKKPSRKQVRKIEKGIHRLGKELLEIKL